MGATGDVAGGLAPVQIVRSPERSSSPGRDPVHCQGVRARGLLVGPRAHRPVSQRCSALGRAAAVSPYCFVDASAGRATSQEVGQRDRGSTTRRLRDLGRCGVAVPEQCATAEPRLGWTQVRCRACVGIVRPRGVLGSRRPRWAAARGGAGRGGHGSRPSVRRGGNRSDRPGPRGCWSRATDCRIHANQGVSPQFGRRPRALSWLPIHAASGRGCDRWPPTCVSSTPRAG
jgi:hypothetical protein